MKIEQLQTNLFHQRKQICTHHSGTTAEIENKDGWKKTHSQMKTDWLRSRERIWMEKQTLASARVDIAKEQVRITSKMLSQSHMSDDKYIGSDGVSEGDEGNKIKNDVFGTIKHVLEGSTCVKSFTPILTVSEDCQYKNRQNAISV